ncbi:hypothetical protein [Glaciihabitans sp. dw_435]|uniref:hypothetical protein n=1 Tax=Glaciihabitans sp. dw_435 TaxID=2720081 RepID=UPI001BD49A16|nr:hypothetical protein [Glaciihabitans sp. dw_435]
MAIDSSTFSWLPDHHRHVAYTLAHVDKLIGELAGILFSYLDDGPFKFANQNWNDRSYVVLRDVRALPESVPRIFADATTQLRAAIEHTIYTQVEHELGTTAQNADFDGRGIEMPAHLEEQAFAKWSNDSRRKLIGSLQPGSTLHARIRSLQPFLSEDPERHPMRVLAEYTNFAKHRSPSIANVGIGPVIPDFESEGLNVAAGAGSRLRPAKVGDVVASGPRGVLVPLSICPNIAVQQPHTQDWNVLMHELNNVAEWVRRTAIPTLITGSSDVAALPPGLDLRVAHEDFSSALLAANRTTSFERNQRRIMAHGVRDGLADVLSAGDNPRVEYEAALTWARTLDDADVLARMSVLEKVAGAGDLAEAERLVGAIVQEVLESAPLDAS